MQVNIYVKFKMGKGWDKAAGGFPLAKSLWLVLLSRDSLGVLSYRSRLVAVLELSGNLYGFK